jgi:hypothetical protein
MSAEGALRPCLRHWPVQGAPPDLAAPAGAYRVLPHNTPAGTRAVRASALPDL